MSRDGYGQEEERWFIYDLPGFVADISLMH